MSVAILIVAAGRGRRLGGDIPKQYIGLHGACALRRSIDVFLGLPVVDHVQVVIHADDQALFDDAVAGIDDPRFLGGVSGGETRAASVRNGLDALTTANPTRVLIHDAARPFVSARIITDLIEALETSDGACAALPVVDALWRSQDGRAVENVPRDGLWRAQTPQAFHFAPLLAAHHAHDGSGADDVFVAREAGLNVTFVLGDEDNFKITTPADLTRARAKLGDPQDAQ